MVIKIRKKCMLCGADAVIEFNTSLGAFVLHAECVDDLERMIAAHEQDYAERLHQANVQDEKKRNKG